MKIPLVLLALSLVLLPNLAVPEAAAHVPCGNALPRVGSFLQCLVLWDPILLQWVEEEIDHTIP